jgi:hypothetical protein
MAPCHIARLPWGRPLPWTFRPRPARPRAGLKPDLRPRFGNLAPALSFAVKDAAFVGSKQVRLASAMGFPARYRIAIESNPP